MDLNLTSSDSTVDYISKLKGRYEYLDAQKQDIEFYQRCIVNEYLDAIKRRTLLPMVFPRNPKFYESLLNTESDNYKRNRKFVSAILKECLVGVPVRITGFISEGWTTYRLLVRFTAEGNHYELQIPVVENITMNEICYNSYIDWDIFKFRLLRKDSEVSWKEVWKGCDIADCDYFQGNDPEELPFT